MPPDSKRRKKRPSNAVAGTGKAGEDRATVVARTVLRPSVQAAATVQQYSAAFGELELTSLVDALTEQIRESQTGDLQRAEGMLAAQAHTLDAIFNNLARRAVNAEYMDNFDRYLKLALRAQSQCRATWEALATIKNPPVVGYVRQANIAHGPQQVNNASPAGTGISRARENPNSQNELLEERDGERLDPGTTGTPGRADPAMAPVGEVDGTKDRGR